jgi:hypothetical protein
MKTSFLFLGLVIPLILTGCGQGKLKTENQQLKQQLDLMTEKADNDLALANGEYEMNYDRYKHTIALAGKIKDIKINLAGMILKSRTQLAVGIFNVETLMTTGSVQKI